MANVVREDVVRVSFDVQEPPFSNIGNQVNDMCSKAQAATENVSHGAQEASDAAAKAAGGTSKIGEVIEKLAANAAGKLGNIKGALLQIGIAAANKAAYGIGMLIGKLLRLPVDTLKTAAKWTIKLGEAAGKAALNGAKMAAKFTLKAGVVGLAAMSAGVVKLTKDAFDLGSAFEQNVGGVKVLFGDAASIVEQNARKASQSLGVNMNDYMQQATSFAATLTAGLGGDTVAAAQAADDALRQMADNSSAFGTDIGSIQNAYQGFAKQNYTMLDNLKLGYGGTASEMARLINESGVLGKSMKVDAKTVKDVPFDQVIKAIGVTQERLGIAGNAAHEASNTISGSIGAVKATWDNLLIDMASGNDIGADIDQLTDNIIHAADNIMPVVTRILENIPRLASSLLEKVGPKLVPVLGDTITELVNSISNTLPTLLPVLFSTLGTMVQSVAQNLYQNFPAIVSAAEEIIPQIADGISQALPQIVQIGGQIISRLADRISEAAPNLIPQGVSALLDFIQGAVSALPQVIQIGGQILSSIGTGIINSLPVIEEQGPQIIHDLFENIIAAIPGALQGLVEFLAGVIPEIPKMLLGAIQGAGSGIMDGIKSWFTGGGSDGSDAGAEASNKIASGFTSDLTTVEQPRMVTAATETAEATQEPFNSIDLTSSGEMAGEGFANGLAAARPAIIAQAQGIADDVSKTVNTSLQIHSPSKVGERTGAFYDQGIVNGLEKSQGNVYSAARAVSGAVSDPARGTTGGGSTSVTKSTAHTVNNFAPAFTLNMNGASATAETERKVRRWIRDGINDTFASIGRQAGVATA